MGRSVDRKLPFLHRKPRLLHHTVQEMLPIRFFCGPSAGYAHHGMLAAAEALLAEEEGALRQALAAHPGYGLHIIGHSLGAGEGKEGDGKRRSAGSRCKSCILGVPTALRTCRASTSHAARVVAIAHAVPAVPQAPRHCLRCCWAPPPAAWQRWLPPAPRRRPCVPRAWPPRQWSHRTWRRSAHTTWTATYTTWVRGFGQLSVQCFTPCVRDLCRRKHSACDYIFDCVSCKVSTCRAGCSPARPTRCIAAVWCRWLRANRRVEMHRVMTPSALQADLVSRCSVVSLRRLAAELSAASEEVMARSELAQVGGRRGYGAACNAVGSGDGLGDRAFDGT